MKNLKLVVSFVILACGNLLAQDNLIAFYPFSGDVADQCSDSIGTLINGATVTDRLNIGNNNEDALSLPSSVVDGLNDFTFSAILKLDSLHDQHHWVNGARSSQKDALMIFYRQSQDRWEITIDNATFIFATNTVIEDMASHHVAVVRHGTTARIYIDGEEVGNGISVSATQLNIEAGGFIIGQDQDFVGGGFEQHQSWAGQIDNLRIFNEAQTPAEIQELYEREMVEGLIAHYTFDSSADDESGNKFHGSLVAGATTTGSLNIGDNATDALSLPSAIVNGLTDFTFSALLQIDAPHLNNGQNHWLNGARGSLNDALAVHYRESQEQWEITIDNVTHPFDTNTAIEDLNCHHVVVQREGSIARLYIDGVEIGNGIAVASTAFSVDPNGFIVGQDQDFVGGGFEQHQSWAGQIDNLRIYDRALGAAEIQALYDREMESSVVAHWTFHERAGTIVSDVSGNNDGVIQGATWGDGGLSFDGVDDYVSVPHSASYTPTDQITIEAIFKLSDLNQQTKALLSKKAGGGFSFHINRPDDFFFGQLAFDDGDKELHFPMSELSPDTWHHVAITYDGSFVKLFLDGAVKDSAATTGNFYHNSGCLFFGAELDVGCAPLPNQFGAVVLDAVRIASKALNSSQFLKPSKRLVFLARKKIKINHSDFIEGSIHCNNEILIGQGQPTTFAGDVRALGNVEVFSDNTIDGDVVAGGAVTVSGATITGNVISNAALNRMPLPTLEFGPFNGARIVVSPSSSQSVSPGEYGLLRCRPGASLNLSSGNYNVNRLVLDRNSSLKLDLNNGPITLNVDSRLLFRKNTEITIVSAKGSSEDIHINYDGRGKVLFGKDSRCQGNVVAPTARVKFGGSASFHGAVVARRIDLKRNTKIRHHDFPGGIPKDGSTHETDDDETVVENYELSQNFPNPFNPSTKISFALPNAGIVELKVFDLLGNRVTTVFEGQLNAGHHSMIWDGRNHSGERLAAGTYFYRLSIARNGHSSATVLMKKMTLLK